MSTESLVQQDGCDNHTHEGKPAHAYNITMPQALPVGAALVMFLDISFTILWRSKLKSPQNGNLKKRIIHLSRNITHMTYTTFIFVKVF